MRITALIAAALTLAACAHTPVQAQQPVTVSQERLMADVTALSADAMSGRGFGENEAARDHIIQAFQDAGAQPFSGPWLLFFTAQGIEGANVAGVFRGTDDPGQWIIISAHYDHEGVQNGEIYNGADDNASGTAALLEIARQLRDHPPRHSVMLLALDGEEAGLLGARAFAESGILDLENVVLNINLDMIARGDNGILWAVGTRLYPALREVVDRVPQQPGIERRYGYDDPAVRGRNNWVNLSDQAAFHARGVPFIFYSVDDHADYHRPTDDAERINAAWYRGAVQTAWDTFDAVDHMERPNFRPEPAASASGKPGAGS